MNISEEITKCNTEESEYFKRNENQPNHFTREETSIWYWAYDNNPITWIFNTLEEARHHAIKTGMFDEICGKDAMMAYDEELFFELVEYELEDYYPYLIIERARKRHDTKS